MPLSRRAFLASGVIVTLPGAALADTEVGVAVGAKGTATLEHAGGDVPLANDAPIYENDTVRTAAESFAELMLVTQARINLGPESEITLDAFTAALGGDITIGGAMVFDRPDDLPPVEHTIRTTLAQIGVRGTKFFVGPSKGALSVFAERGEVVVTTALTTRTLGPGDGVQVELESGGAGLTEVVRWGEDRIRAAYASVGL